MTGSNSVGQSGEGGDNRIRRASAIEAFRDALVRACEPSFTGTVAVEVSAKQGRLGGPKVTTVQWPK